MPLSLPSTEPGPLAAGLERTDAFHRQALFLVIPARGQAGHCQVVRSWNEAHALHGPAQPDDVNPAYVAALISGHHNAAVSPYRRIRRLPRAHHVLIGSDGTVQTAAYDPLAGGAEAMAAGPLHAFLRQGLLDHLQRQLQRHAGAIGCEHSSGLDSNALIGGLRRGLGLTPQRLHTWSDEWGGEGRPLREFREFHGLLQHHCLSRRTADAPFLTPQQKSALELRLFGAPAQIGGNPEPTTLLAQQGCSLIFSGFGGDQALSHNANNVPTDLVAQGRWWELLRWMGGPRRAIRTAAGRSLGLHVQPWARHRLRMRSRGFCTSDLLQRSLTAAGSSWLGAHLGESHPWEIDGYLTMAMSIRRRVLADWVAVRVDEECRMAAAHGVRKAFPLLDERLIGTLLQQDPLLFGEGMGRGRLVHRRAFAPFLPPDLQENPSKVRVPEEGHQAWWAAKRNRVRQELAEALGALDSLHRALGQWWDLAAIRQEAESVLASEQPTARALLGTTGALTRLQHLSHWWQALDS